MAQNFWEQPLDTLTAEQWEALCDGCGRCCLKKFQDDDSGKLYFTRVICHLFDQETSKCTSYARRSQLVPDCIDVKKLDIAQTNWMPDTCAYRLRFEQKELPDWHPLLTGSRDAMVAAGIAVAGKVVSEQHVHPLGYGEHIIKWVKA